MRWVDGLDRRHGLIRWSFEPSRALVLTAADGAVARLEPFAPEATSLPGSPAGPCPADPRSVGSRARHGTGRLDLDDDRLRSWAEPPATLGLVLVRRGGYAVGLAVGDRLATHRCGTRYVQSRTAAGGWSQQRFARRRANQADALVGVVTEQVLRLVVPGGPDGVVVGGDRALVRAVLADHRVAPCASAVRRELYDLPDPRLSVLKTALRRGRAVRITVTDPR